MSDLERLAELLATQGSPVGRLRGAIYRAQLSADPDKLPLREQAVVFAEFAGKMGAAAGMSLAELLAETARAYRGGA